LNEPKTIRRLIRLPEVLHFTGLGKTILYAMLKDGEFPASVRIGAKAVAWVEAEVAQWADDRISKSRLTPQTSLRLAA